MSIRISISLVFLSIFFGAGIASAQLEEFQRGNGPLHVKAFELFDDSGLGFSTGRYESGLPDCDTSQFPLQCSMNGYIELDWTAANLLPPVSATGLEVVFWMLGPSFDLNGVAIPGTEDDVIVVTLTIVDVKNTPGSLFYKDFVVVGIDIDGTNAQFQNGVPIDHLSISLSDNQVIGDGWVALGAEQIGWMDPVPTPVESLIDPLFGIHYQVEFEPVGQPMFLPEPSFAMSIVLGIAGLSFAARRRSHR